MLARLSSREEFTQALKAPVVARTAHFVLHGPGQMATTDVQARFGCVLPKRWAKRAVTRNLLRRLLLNIAQERLMHAPGGTYVARLKAAMDIATYPSASSSALRVLMREELQTLFARARLTA